MRTELAYVNGEEIKTTPVKSLKQHIIDGEIQADTQVFNNLVANVGELREKWQTEAKNSWLSRYF